MTEYAHGTRSQYTNNGCRCPECVEANRAYLAKYREENPEIVRAANAAWYVEHRESELERRREEYVENRDEIAIESAARYQRTREQRIAAQRIYNHASRARRREITRARDKAVGYISVAVLDELFAAQSGRCAYCGRAIGPGFRHLDHIVPISAGGTNDVENLAWACPPCNLSKGARSLLQWANKSLRRGAGVGFPV